MTAYVRIGDARLKLGRTAEAEAAYRIALSKSDVSVAARNGDLPALLPIAAAHARLGDLKLASISNLALPEQDVLRREGCGEYKESEKIASLIPVAIEFNPANYPLAPLRPAQWAKVCNVPKQ